MQTREMRDLPDELKLSYLEHKRKGLPERVASIEAKKAKIRELQDEVNKENRLVVRDTGAASRIEQVCVEAGLITKDECQFFGKESDEGETPPAESETAQV